MKCRVDCDWLNNPDLGRHIHQEAQHPHKNCLLSKRFLSYSTLIHRNTNWQLFTESLSPFDTTKVNKVNRVGFTVLNPF